MLVPRYAAAWRLDSQNCLWVGVGGFTEIVVLHMDGLQMMFLRAQSERQLCGFNAV